MSASPTCYLGQDKRANPVGMDSKECNKEEEAVAAEKEEEEEEEEEPEKEANEVPNGHDDYCSQLVGTSGGSEDNGDCEKRLRGLLRGNTNCKAKKHTVSKRKPHMSDNALSFFINAHVLTGQKHCHCYHANQFFANDKARKYSILYYNSFTGNYLPVTDLPYCCKCCHPKTPWLRCDLCKLDEIDNLIPQHQDTASSKPRRKNKIKLDKFTLSKSEESLKKVLFKWHGEKARELYSELDYYGEDIFIHHWIIGKIITLAHKNKLKDVQALRDQTHWDLAEEYSHEIIELVTIHCPLPAVLPLFASTLLAAGSCHHSLSAASKSADSSSATTANPHIQCATKCSTCGQIGHNHKFSFPLSTMFTQG